MNSAKQQRWEILFGGQVQGVGFRYTTRRIAQDFTVSGYVKNLPDGRVQVVAEGPVGELEAFVGRIERAMQDSICSKRVEVSGTTNEFSAFEIRH